MRITMANYKFYEVLTVHLWLWDILLFTANKLYSLIFVKNTLYLLTKYLINCALFKLFGRLNVTFTAYHFVIIDTCNQIQADYIHIFSG